MRHEDWVPRLFAALESHAQEAYRYGSCVAIAADVVDSISIGTTWRESIEPLIADEETARASIAAPGALEAIVTQRLGQPVPMSQAMRGDVVLIDLLSGPSLGICTGDRIAAPAAKVGIVNLKRLRGIKAWRIT